MKKNKNPFTILLTGGAGFIASHVAEAYMRLGHKVVIVDDLSTGKKTNVPKGAVFYKMDVRAPRLKDIFRKEKIDVVNHHAAQIDVRKSVADPVLDAQVNILGLLKVLENARIHKVKKIIFSASGGTYYGECSRPARETDTPDPLSPYGVTKLSSEFYLRAYRALHGLHYTVLRYGNVYGPRQDPHGEAGVVAIFCQRILAKEPLWIFGDGHQQRDYVFVEDVARANVAALSKGADGAFNIGTGRPASVNDLVRILQKASSHQKKPIHKPKRPGELFRSCLNIQKAAKGLGWKPQVRLEEGLAKTFSYFQAK